MLIKRNRLIGKDSLEELETKHYQSKYGAPHKCCVCKKYIKPNRVYYNITADGKINCCKKCMEKRQYGK